jgi:hypothetical protein
MVFHPPGIVVEIVFPEAGNRGCTCEEHTVNCGEVLEEDVVVRLWKVQVVVDGREEMAIAAIWVTDGIDRCCVGFLKHHMVRHAGRFDGALAQVTRVFSSDLGSYDSAEHWIYHHYRGCCLATIILSLPVVSSVKEEGEDNDTRRWQRGSVTDNSMI